MSAKTVVSVVGFLFWRGQVLLVRKDRPFWQKGKLNGVGGKVEEGETAVTAMIREFSEETGLSSSTTSWVYRACIEYDGGRVQFFSFDLPDIASVAPKNPDPTEPLEWHSWLKLPKDVLPNLRWLIPFCQDTAATGPIGVRYDRQMAHAIGDNTLAASVGKRHFVTTRDGGQVIGTVSAADNDGITLTDLHYVDEEGSDKDATLLIQDANLETLVPFPPDERQLLLIAECAYNSGARDARKE